MLVVPAGTCGQASGALDLIRAAEREISERKLQEKIRLKVTGCHGFCQMEPSVLIAPSGTFYPQVKPADMHTIIDSLLEGKPAVGLLFRDENGNRIEKQDDIPFYRGQKRLLLSRNESIDPLTIDDYLRDGGYSAFASILSEGDPGAVIDTIKKSGLRGRGGAGFPTGAKWEFLAARPNGSGKFIVCNADEGDPGAYMDRSLLEGNPHSIIEGMLICAFATGADRGVMYVRIEYPLAIRHLDNALRQARSLGLLGKNILGSGMDFDISLVKGAGAFVCGEETALMRSIEGRMGEPRQRPPFPVQSGIDGKPTLINNVETWANIPVIFEMGPKAYAAVGHDNAGTKIFSLVGKIKNTGLVEVPMGLPIREIVYSIGGGASGSATIKAVQTGGPSGGCIPAEMFDLPIGYETLSKAGSIMGSGGMIVMDEDDCMIDIAKFYLGFCVDESCGKCAPCRIGGTQMLRLLEKISEGRGVPKDLEQLAMISRAMQKASLCGLGQTAPNPVLSTLNYYRAEYDAHVNDKKCPACKCSKLLSFLIRQDKCVKCGMCFKACPVGAISGNREKGYVIDQEKCIRCGQCFEVCKPAAVLRQ